MNPFQLHEDKGGFKVPCGKCLNCKRRRASSWSVRLVKEGERSISAIFLTLTYDTDHVPITKNGFMNLEKKALQLFFKRLRKCHPKNHTSLKYYAVGEYGGKTNRPHYHIVLFNCLVNTIEKAWTLGNYHIGSITDASIGYTLKYISKASKVPMHKNDDRQKEFSLMSKGLGTNYLTDKMIKWHKANPTERVYVPLLDGKKAPLPRYYKQKIYDESEKDLIALHFQNKATLLLESELKEHGNNLQSFKAQQYLNGNRKLKINYSDKI